MKAVQSRQDLDAFEQVVEMSVKELAIILKTLQKSGMLPVYYFAYFRQRACEQRLSSKKEEICAVGNHTIVGPGTGNTEVL